MILMIMIKWWIMIINDNDDVINDENWIMIMIKLIILILMMKCNDINECIND